MICKLTLWSPIRLVCLVIFFLNLNGQGILANPETDTEVCIYVDASLFMSKLRIYQVYYGECTLLTQIASCIYAVIYCLPWRKAT